MSSGKVVRTFYRILMRNAKVHDANPALKGILVVQRLTYYDKFRKIWLDVRAPNAGPEAEAILEHMKVLLGGGTCYLPEVKATQVVRNAFKNPLFGSTLRVPPGMDAKDISLDVAAACIRIFERNLAKGKEIGIHTGVQDGGNSTIPSSPSERKYDVERTREASQGYVILAHPLQVQGNLARSAILLVRHDRSGSFGLVLNRRMPFTIGDLLGVQDKQGIPGVVRKSLEVFRNNVIFRGGDVGVSFLSVLHPHGGLKGSQRVSEGVYWQCNLADAIELINSGQADPQSFKMFMGYAGWGDKQLEGEMKLNSWLVVKDKQESEGGVRKLTYTWGNEHNQMEDADYARAAETWMDEDSWTDMVDDKASQVWTDVWESLGGEYAEMSRIPPRTTQAP